MSADDYTILLTQPESPVVHPDTDARTEFERVTDGRDYDQGQLEDMEKSIEKLRAVTARLFEIAARRMTDAEISYVLHGWHGALRRVSGPGGAR